MISAAGRCSHGRTAASVSKECRTAVNGGGAGGYVNRCELNDKNEMVMASKTSGDHQQSSHATATKAASNKRGDDEVYGPCDRDELDGLKEFALGNLELIDEFKILLVKKDEKIMQLSKEVDFLKIKLDEANQHLAEIAAREESLDVLPFTPVSSTCSSGMGDLSSAELPEQQDSKNKKRKSRQVVAKQPTSDPSGPNQTKRQRTRSSRTKSGDLGKMQEMSLITADNAYYTCLGNYDPIKDDPIPEYSNSNLEIPSWRVKTYSSWYSMEGTENMSDDIFENRHSRLEIWERKRKRWDMQRIRELRRIEYLREGRNKHHSQNSVHDSDKVELTTLLPDPTNIKAIEVTHDLPVSAFGSNLHVKKKLELFKFYHSQWCNDGSQVPPERNVRGLRSSGRSQFYDTL